MRAGPEETTEAADVQEAAESVLTYYNFLFYGVGSPRYSSIPLSGFRDWFRRPLDPRLISVSGVGEDNYKTNSAAVFMLGKTAFVAASEGQGVAVVPICGRENIIVLADHLAKPTVLPPRRSILNMNDSRNGQTGVKADTVAYQIQDSTIPACGRSALRIFRFSDDTGVYLTLTSQIGNRGSIIVGISADSAKVMSDMLRQYIPLSGDIRDISELLTVAHAEAGRLYGIANTLRELGRHDEALKVLDAALGIVDEAEKAIPGRSSSVSPEAGFATQPHSMSLEVTRALLRAEKKECKPAHNRVAQQASSQSPEQESARPTTAALRVQSPGELSQGSPKATRADYQDNRLLFIQSVWMRGLAGLGIPRSIFTQGLGVEFIEYEPVGSLRASASTRASSRGVDILTIGPPDDVTVVILTAVFHIDNIDNLESTLEPFISALSLATPQWRQRERLAWLDNAAKDFDSATETPDYYVAWRLRRLEDGVGAVMLGIRSRAPAEVSQQQPAQPGKEATLANGTGLGVD